MPLRFLMLNFVDVVGAADRGGDPLRWHRSLVYFPFFRF